MFRKICCLAVLFVSMLAETSHADVTLFTDVNLFNAAANNLTALDFSTLVGPSATYSPLANPFDVGGITFEGPSFLAATSPAYSSSYDYGIGTVLTSFGPNGNLTDALNSFHITLPGNVNVVAFRLANSFHSATGGLSGSFEFDVTTASGTTFLMADAVPQQAAFFGLISTEDISLLDISNLTDPAAYQDITTYAPFTNLGSFIYGEVDLAAVPVPAAVWLLGSGLLGLIGLHRRA